MNFENMGKFLKELRKERNLTQEELAENLNFDRTVISKWECGRKLPSVENIDALAKFYDVSINELVYGERMNKENAKEIRNIPIKIMSESQRRIHRIHTACIVTLLSAIFMVLIGYFLSNYNSIKVYRVGGSNDNYVIKNTLMIISKHRSYLNFGEIDIIGDDDETIYYDNYELYVKNGDTKIVLASREDGDLVEGLEKIDNYLNFDNIQKFIDNIFIDIYDDDNNIITIKLDVTLEMTNNKVFYVNDDDAEDIDDNNVMLKNKSLPKFVRRKFSYDEEKDMYVYSKEIDSENIEFEYDSKSKTLNIYENNLIYNYEFESRELAVSSVSNNTFKQLLICNYTKDVPLNFEDGNLKKYYEKFSNYYEKIKEN